ncbi:MAG: ATP-binding protein [Thermodesulfobacteriota bacterium]
MSGNNAQWSILTPSFSRFPEEESRYRNLLRAATDYTYTVLIEEGRPYRTIHSISSFAVTGYTPDDYERNPFLWLEMVHEEDRAVVTEQMARLLAGQEIPPFEHRIHHKDGSIRWVRNTVVPHYDENGQLIEYDALVSDITAPRLAATKIVRANRAYRTLSRCNQTLVRAHDEKEMLARVCQILTEEGGYPLAWVGYASHDQARSIRVVAACGAQGDTLRKLRTRWTETGATGQSPTARAIHEGQVTLAREGREESLGGHRFAIALPLSVDKEIIGALTLHTDEANAFDQEEVEFLSELAADLSFGIAALRVRKKHKAAVKAVVSSNMRLEAIFDTVQAGIVIIDMESRKITDVNAVASQLIGLPPQKIVGRRCHRFICPADKEQCPLLDLGQTIDNSQQALLQSCGRELPILKSVVQLELNGRPCLLESFLDISKRVEAEGERLRLQAQLRQSQKMEAIGTLAGGIAHDFNNMLQAILGYASLLLHSLPEGSEHHQFAAAIKDAGISAASLVKQILTFSRHNAPERKPLRVQYLLKEALKLLRSTLPTTIAFRERINSRCSAVLADSTEIHQIIMNLGTNAYHAMRERGGILSVELDEIEADPTPAIRAEVPELVAGKRYVRLIVADTGQGIDEGTLPRIFEPYFTTKGEGEGTGLGLAIVHGIVQNYQGAIMVRSVVGEGSTFTLFFPVHEESAALAETTADPQAHLPRFNCTVLLVDDIRLNVVLGEYTLRRLGCTVVGFTDSEEALKTFRAAPGRFDLLVTDQTMPQLTGIELATEVLKIRPDLPIIMATGHSETVDENKALASGIRKFLMKPVTLDTVSQAMSDLFPQQTAPELRLP